MWREPTREFNSNGRDIYIYMLYVNKGLTTTLNESSCCGAMAPNTKQYNQMEDVLLFGVLLEGPSGR